MGKRAVDRQEVWAALEALGLCPEGDIEGARYKTWERNARAELHDLVERSPRDVLWILREVAWALTG
jgi:hypothetical protein